MIPPRLTPGRTVPRAPGAFRAVWAALWSVMLLAEGASPVLAQRRRTEPEANPQFQQDVQGPPPAQLGGPVEAPKAGREPAEPSAPGRGVPSVQIGAASDAPATPAAPTNPLETRVTVRVKEAPLATFLDTISAQARVNFIITEGLEHKKVTAFLQNVTVREALQILLEIKGLTYQQIGRSNTYVVSPRSKSAPVRITRIYTLSYISLIPVLGQAAGASGAGGTAGTTGGLGLLSEGIAGALPGVGVVGGGSGKAAQDSPVAIINILRSVLSKEGSVAIDPRTNALIVTDIPEVFPQVEEIIAELDKKAPQVMIEAQIVEINSNRAQELGLDWGGTDGRLAVFSAGRRDTSFPFSIPPNSANAHFFQPGDALTKGELNLTALTVVLRALVSRAEARFLGKPKVLTLNNKSAMIEITRDQAVAQQQQSTSVGSTGGATTTQQLERKETGLRLAVTPQVNKAGHITLLIEPSFRDVVPSAIGNNNFDTVKRAASTLVRVKNGQTLALGGLLSSNERKTVRKVPFLGYIPVIGWLFTSVSTKRENTDLVIFITPTVVND